MLYKVSHNFRINFVIMVFLVLYKFDDDDDIELGKRLPRMHSVVYTSLWAPGPNYRLYKFDIICIIYCFS